MQSLRTRAAVLSAHPRLGEDALSVHIIAQRAS